MPPPPIYGHSQNLYAAFLSRSVEADEAIAHDFGVPVGANLYIGHWSTEFTKDPALPGETTLQKAHAWLQEKGCIDVLRSGGREYKGIILLDHAPGLDDLRSDSDTSASRHGQIGMLRVATEGLTTRTGDLEKAVTTLDGQIRQLTLDVELRLRQLDGRVGKLETHFPGEPGAA